MHRLNPIKLKPGVGAFYNNWPENKSGLFTRFWGPHGICAMLWDFGPPKH